MTLPSISSLAVRSTGHSEPTALFFWRYGRSDHELARRHADMGFTAIKFGWGPMGQSEAHDIALAREARRGAGEDVDILVDAGQVWDWKTALQRAESFAEHYIMAEEPLHPQDVAGMPSYPLQVRCPYTGEAESNLTDFERFLTEGEIDWVQPDPAAVEYQT